MAAGEVWRAEGPPDLPSGGVWGGEAAPHPTTKFSYLCSAQYTLFSADIYVVAHLFGLVAGDLPPGLALACDSQADAADRWCYTGGAWYEEVRYGRSVAARVCVAAGDAARHSHARRCAGRGRYPGWPAPAG